MLESAADESDMDPRVHQIDLANTPCPGKRDRGIGLAHEFPRLTQMIVLLVVAACSTISFAQELAYEEAELIDQQPFDLLVLTEDEGGQQFKLEPLSMRRMPASPDPAKKIEVVLQKYPDRLYEITWKAIDEILFYEQRIYDEAIQSMASKDFVKAFQNLSFLLKNYPTMPELEGLRRRFILESAIDRNSKGELQQTLSALEELKETAPDYERTKVTNGLSRTADSLIGRYQANGDLGSAQTLLNRLRRQYGPTLPAVAAWDKRLENLALSRKTVAEDFMAEGKFREARKAAVEMLSIFPDLPEARELIQKINEIHPMVRVGVMQRSTQLDPSSLVDWPARRAGALVKKTLFNFLETGSEGGRYGFALGTFRMTDDRQQILLTLDPNIQSTITAFSLAQQLVQRGDPDSEIYDPSWAAIFDSVTTRTATQVLVNLRRPNVLPHSLMQWALPDDQSEPDALPGDYAVSTSDDTESSFRLRAETPGSQPVEVVEVFYDDPRAAVNDLLRGEIDVLDQLYPADANRLAADSRLTVGSYALPTSHMLIPISDHAYLGRTKFRRALLYAVDREQMLAGELLNSKGTSAGRLISGPFPLGNGESDPLAYAYNPEIRPTPYSPELARLLVVMSTQELFQLAEKRREPPPKLKPLVVGCPDFEFARVAVQAMIQQWANVGIQAEMKILNSIEDAKAEGCDLAYVITTMWEPATDIERLLGGNGIATTDDPYIIQGLERLRNCRNWREIRVAMQDLHQLIDFHLPLLPLWQVTDRFAVNNRIKGLEDRPVSLYQNVANWRINLAAPSASGSR